MRIRSVEIENFRCLDNVKVAFEEITTFIGPNGSGKSSVLRALDWFFNGDKSMVPNVDDVFSGAPEPRISVRVDFDDLTEKDRDQLGDKYAPTGVNELTVWRTWADGKDKITGRALAYAPFESVRRGETATTRKAAYLAVVAAHTDLTFSSWTSDGVAEQMMTDWERAHPDLLEASTVSGTNFFGFAGQGVLSGLFDFVLITADMRAAEESLDTKNSVIGRILEKVVDRSVAEGELTALNDELTTRHQAITDKYFTDQLKALSADLTVEVTSFAPGRTVEIGSVPAEFKPQSTKFKVKIDDHGTKTDVERQGHGFQRSLLIAALKLLAERGSARADKSVILLAVEEPELFQHPTQAKAFATVLRKLAEDPDAGIQVSYATHSPYFIEPTYFDQVRRVERDVSAAAGAAQVVIHHASMDGVVGLLAGYVDESAVRHRLDNSCLNELREALFARAVLLVEGPTDRAIFEGVAEAGRPLSSSGVEVAVANSKPQLYLPAAILKQLGIPFFTVFDSDAGSGDRVRAKGGADAETKGAAQETADAIKNRQVLTFFGATEVDWPTGVISDDLAAFEDTLEAVVAVDWAAFETERAALVAAGRGAEGKNAATYRLAARSAAGPPASITDIVQKVVAKAA